MRLVIVGAGAIGGSLAAELSLSGADVVVVARGVHGQRIADHGLHYLTPHRDCHVVMPRVSGLGELSFQDDDVIIVTTKIDDVAEVAENLARIDATLPVLCLQNGVAGERIAAEHLEPIYAGMVYLPATYLNPGRVENFCSNGPGALRIGRYQGGNDALCERLSAVLAGAGFNADAVTEIMPWKYGKLLTNLGNAIEVSCTDRDRAGDLYRRAIAEAETCLRAASIAYLSADQLVTAANIQVDTIGDKPRPGGSMWQSVARKRPPEVDYLNGEIVRLGTSWQIPTPINAMLVAAVRETVQDGTRWTCAELADRV